MKGTRSRQPLRVLIADDEALPAELMRRMVMRLGHQVVAVAGDGAEAIALTERHRPDVAILDLRMPRLDGFAAAEAIARNLPTPIVVVSALDDAESFDRAVQAGVCAFLVKPTREDELVRALELAVARFADLQQIERWKRDAEQRAADLETQNAELERVVRELRQTQMQLIGAARRATVASLAQGLAHEINNALTPIIGHAQMLARQTEGTEGTSELEDIRGRADQIVAHAKRIAALTASMRQFMRGSKDEPIPFSLNGVIQDAIALYHERLERMSIRVQLDLDESLEVLEGFPDQIQEVILNVVQNAIDAMPRGGALTIRTRNMGERALAEIRDSGIGILPEDVPVVFEPGFTTKTAEGRSLGFGWGLFTARQIVDAHNGAIEIESQPWRQGDGADHGTSVRIFLPMNVWPKS